MIDKYKDRGLKATLIDYGFANKYVDENGDHVSEEETIGKFQGNLLFASLHQLNFKKTSRKDDLTSLSYLLLYLFNKNELPLSKDFLQWKDQDDLIERYKAISAFKKQNPISNMARSVQFFSG